MTVDDTGPSTPAHHCHTDMFCSEARPYRETFYWESVAAMVSEYLQAHAEASPDLALADCLIATQSPATSDDSDRLTHFRTAWSQILGHSRKRVKAFIKADSELAEKKGLHEIVTGLHAADHRNWKNRTDRSG